MPDNEIRTKNEKLTERLIAMHEKNAGPFY
jgi:hypothetical protein